MVLQMRGPDQVRHIIRDFLFIEFRKTIEGLRAEWGLDEDELPLPDERRYLAREADNLDVLPLIAITTGRALTAKDVHGTGANLGHYTCQYDVRVYNWIKTEGYNAAQDMRDRYATAMKLTLLLNQTFGGRDDIVLDESTMAEEFSDVREVKGDRFVAGSFCGVVVRTDEVLAPFGEVLGTVQTTEVTGQNVATPLPFSPSTLGIHPGLE